MPVRRLLALLLDIDDLGDAVSGLSDDLLGSIMSRSMADSFGDLAGEDGLSILGRAFDEFSQSGPPDCIRDKPVLCRSLYNRLRAGSPEPDVSYEAFQAAFGNFVAAIRDSLALATQPLLIDLRCREFGALSLEELPGMQAPEELLSHTAGLVTYFREQQIISPSDADHMIGLVDKMVSAPGYLRFLGEDKKRQEIAQLLDMAMAIRSAGAPPGQAMSDMIVTIGLLLYNISPSENAASCLASVRPSAACQALQYHYNAIMALNYLLTGHFDLASEHAEMAGRSTVDSSNIAYVLILQGCIAIGHGDFEQAVDLLEKAGSSAPGGRIKALAHFYRGIVFSEEREYANAISCFKEAGVYVADPLDRAVVHNNLGSCARYLGDLSLAERSFTEMEKLSDQLNSDSAWLCRLVTSSHYGAISLAKGEFLCAIESFQKALKLALRSGDGKAIANQLGNVGMAFARSGETETALRYLNACMVYSERLSYWPGIRFSYWHISQQLIEKGNKPEALKFLETYSSRYPELGELR